MKYFRLLVTVMAMVIYSTGHSQDKYYLLVPDRVFDGNQMLENYQVLVKNNYIEAVGQNLKQPTNVILVDLKGTTLMPGLIEGHTHLFLHPYNETSWDDQVLKESAAERVIRASIHARNTLMAGFTTVRDLGTEGSGYDDVGLKKSIIDGLIPGPRLIISTRAIVATGSYGPKVFSADFDGPIGAAEADGVEGVIRETRLQIGKGADVIKVYADYRWSPDKEAAPTFSLEELKAIVHTANSSGRDVVAHASTVEGMKRSILAGVSTIEHGDAGTEEVFRMMKDKGVAYCPTLAAGEAITRYKGWVKGTGQEPERIKNKKASFRAAIASGVIIMMGGDAGVFTHGDNYTEMQLMAEYGMKEIDVLRSATSVNAKVFKMDQRIGKIQPGFYADIIAVEGDPSKDLSLLKNVKFVMKEGTVYKKHTEIK
jgi:imidazolonepropionase-like amidohydrolase